MTDQPGDHVSANQPSNPNEYLAVISGQLDTVIYLLNQAAKRAPLEIKLDGKVIARAIQAQGGAA